MATPSKEPPRSAPGPRLAPDYLGRLAEQAVQAPDAPTLAPRIASRFEPGAFGDTRDDGGLRELEAWVDAGAAPAAAAIAGESAMPPRAQPRARDGFARDAAQRIVDVDRPADSRAPEAPAPRVAAPSLEPPQPAVPHDDARQATERDTSLPRIEARAPATPSTTQAGDAAAESAAHPAGIAQVPAAVPRIGPVERLDPPLVRRPPDTVAATQAHAARERNASAREGATGAAERPAPVAPPPIEIHIDRIDVRGLAPPAPPVHVHHAAAPARGPTGLDELLRRRRGEPA